MREHLIPAPAPPVNVWEERRMTTSFIEQSPPSHPIRCGPALKLPTKPAEPRPNASNPKQSIFMRKVSTPLDPNMGEIAIITQKIREKINLDALIRAFKQFYNLIENINDEISIFQTFFNFATVDLPKYNIIIRSNVP